MKIWKKKLGYKRLQLCSWKKYFSKIWKGIQPGYFCRNFQLAYRGKFLIFFNTWKCARKLKSSILIMSKKLVYKRLQMSNVFLKKKLPIMQKFGPHVKMKEKHFFSMFFSMIPAWHTFVFSTSVNIWIIKNQFWSLR